MNRQSLTETRSSGGQVLGRYRIVRRLAQGGMGVVYLGRLEGAAGFSKPVVIKRVIPDIDNIEETTARFIREAQILSNLQHPGIVAVLDFGEEVGGHCMVLEYVHGYDLSKWLKFLKLQNRDMPWEFAVFIMLRVLEALSYAHDFRRSDGMHTEVLHRDVSPGNILLDVEGRVRLADFGIACMDEGEPGQFKTQTGVLKGKVAFLAPELFAGTAPSASSDVYACAVVLYQMLAGRNPFSAENESRVMWRLITEPPKPLSECRDDLPAELQVAVLRALEKEPEARFASAEALAQSLRSSLDRSEADVGRDLREALRRDFSGELPEMLRMEPLAARDLAWRTGEGMEGFAPDAPPGSFREATPAGPPGPGALQPWQANPSIVDPVKVRAPQPQPPVPNSSSSQTMTSVAAAPSDLQDTVAPKGKPPAPPPRRRRTGEYDSPAAGEEPTLVDSASSLERTLTVVDSVAVSRQALSAHPATVDSRLGPESEQSTQTFTACSSSTSTMAPPGPSAPSSPASLGGAMASIRAISRHSLMAAAGLQMKHVIGIALSVGLAVALGLGVLQYVVQRSLATPGAGRFIVVEGPGVGGQPVESEPAEGAASAKREEPSGEGSADSPGEPNRDKAAGVERKPRRTRRKPKPAPKPVKADAASLSRQFGRQQQQLQGCFERYASDIEGRPQVAVRFDVSASGAVRDVSLSPAPLEKTELGGCLLRVSKATRFAPMERAIRFTIPIEARAVLR